MRRKQEDKVLEKYDDTPAFREWQSAGWAVSRARLRVTDAEADLARSQKALADSIERLAYWKKIVEAENGTPS